MLLLYTGQTDNCNAVIWLILCTFEQVKIYTSDQDIQGNHSLVSQ